MIFKSAQIENYIKNPDTKIKAFLVYGNNDGLVINTVKRVARTICPNLEDAFQVSELNGEDIISDFGKLYGEYNGQSLMGGRRVIILHDADNQITKDLRKMLDDSKSENLLILHSDNFSRKSSLVKLAEGSEDMACVACYEDTEDDVRNTLKNIGLSFEPEALQLLYARFSGDRMINMEELEKLKTYMGDAKNVTVDIVTKVISDQSDSGIEDICYAAMGGNCAKSETLYRKYINEGNEPITVVRALSFHVLKLLTCQAEIEKNVGLDMAIKKLVPPLIFLRVEAFKQQLRIWNRDKILRVLELLYEAEKDCKTTGMPSEEIVSLTLLKIARAAKR